MFGGSLLSGQPTPENVARDKGVSLDVFSPQRGMGITRSDWSPDAVRLDFEDRFDCFDIGHMKTNRNGFYLYSHQRAWITDAGYHGVANDMHSAVLIDGIGEAGCSKKPAWPSLPGKFLEAASTPQFALYAGDAKVAYMYRWGTPKVGTSSYGNQEHGVPTPFRWCDFFPPGYEAPSAVHGTNAWLADFMHADPGLYNPVRKAFRTAILARGPHPYVLIIDDIQKDDQPHSYLWTANTSEGGSDMEIMPGNTPTDGVFMRKADAGVPGSPRLLVRAIQADGQASPVFLNLEPVGDDPARRIGIRRDNTVAPNFKVMLYPHMDGEPAPVTQLQGNKLTVAFQGGPRDEWTTEMDSDGRTVITGFVRNGGTPPEISAPVIQYKIANETTTEGRPCATVNYQATAVDSSGKPATVVLFPISGSHFRQGVTPLVITAYDSEGRTRILRLPVTVK